jgi:hypothetical protein
MNKSGNEMTTKYSAHNKRETRLYGLAGKNFPRTLQGLMQKKFMTIHDQN